MKCPATYRILNDLIRVAAEMQEQDRTHLTVWRRVSCDARNLLRLAIAEDTPSSVVVRRLPERSPSPIPL